MSHAERKLALHTRIETMDDGQLALTERVLLSLETEELNEQLDMGFEADKQSGRLTAQQIQAAIAQVRANRPYV